MAEAERDDVLDVAKGIAIIGVVLIHAHAWLASVGVQSVALDLAAGRLTIPLPEFFLVSGIVLAASVSGPGATRATLWRRTAPVLWVYLVWQPLVFAYRVVGDLWVTHEPVDWAGELTRVIAFPVRPNGELWYLWALALLLTLTYATRRVPTALVLAISAVLFVTVYAFGRLVLGDTIWHGLGPGLQQVVPHWFFVVLGARCGTRVLAVLRRATWWHAVVAVVVWQAFAAAIALLPDPVQSIAVPVQVALGVIATLTVASALTPLCRRWRAAQWLPAIGRGSLPVYVLHMSAIVLVLTVVVQTGTLGLLQRAPLVSAACLVAAAIGIATAVGHGIARSSAAWLFRAPASVVHRGSAEARVARTRSRRPAS